VGKSGLRLALLFLLALFLSTPAETGPSHLPQIADAIGAQLITDVIIPPELAPPVFPDRSAEVAIQREAVAAAKRAEAVSRANSNPKGYAASLVGQGEYSCLDVLWEKESGWDPWAVNPNSGAYGIPQSLGHGEVYALGAGKDQVDWGLNYIRERYGDACTALGFHYRNNYY